MRHLFLLDEEAVRNILQGTKGQEKGLEFLQTLLRNCCHRLAWSPELKSRFSAILGRWAKMEEPSHPTLRLWKLLLKNRGKWIECKDMGESPLEDKIRDAGDRFLIRLEIPIGEKVIVVTHDTRLHRDFNQLHKQGHPYRAARFAAAIKLAAESSQERLG